MTDDTTDLSDAREGYEPIMGDEDSEVTDVDDPVQLSDESMPSDFSDNEESQSTFDLSAFNEPLFEGSNTRKAEALLVLTYIMRPWVCLHGLESRKDVSERDSKRDCNRDLNYVRLHGLQTPFQSRSGTAHCE